MPFKSIPTPHLRGGRLIFQIEDSFIAIDVTGMELYRSPLFKAPFGGQEFILGDVPVAGRTIRIGGI